MRKASMRTVETLWKRLGTRLKTLRPQDKEML
jgi:hypothetical protein